MTTTYTISISEQQRSILERALVDLFGVQQPKWDNSEADEPHALRELLAGLPVDAQDAEPGSIHSFVL